MEKIQFNRNLLRAPDSERHGDERAEAPVCEDFRVSQGEQT